MKKRLESLKNKNAFTLIELMVVVAIIGVLALLGLRLYAGQQDKAKVAIVFANAETVQTAIQAEYVDNPALTVEEARASAAACKIRNPFTSADDSGFDTASPGAVVITGNAGGPFTITGYDENGDPLPNPLTAYW